MVAPDHYNFNLFNSLTLGGIVQGLLFGVVVASSKKYRDTGTLLLAALIVAFSLNNLQYYVADAHLVRLRYLYGITWTPLQLLLGPLVYFYGLKLLFPEKSIPRKTIIGLLLPFALGWLAITYVKATRTYLEAKMDYLYLEALLEFISNVLATFAVSKLLWLTHKAERDAESFGVSIVLQKLQWFRNILITFLILCVVWLVVIVLMVLSIEPDGMWYVIWLSLSVMIYCLGHIGIYKYGVLEERKKIRSHTLNRSSVTVIDRYKNDYVSRFEDLLINKKYFLNPDLTLDNIAEELNLSKSHLSRIINKEMKTTFPEYMNELRVKEAKFYLRHPDFGNYTLVAIGLEAGFASKTSFNNTFKKVTGMTPSEYKNSEIETEPSAQSFV